MKLYSYHMKREFVREVQSYSISHPQTAAQAIRESIDFEREQEQLVVLLLNGRNHLKGSFLVTLGSVDSSIVHPRDVFKPAIVQSCTGIIIGHNHPSGDYQPSPADISVYKRIREAGTILGIALVDGLIVTETHYYSFKEKGHL